MTRSIRDSLFTKTSSLRCRQEAENPHRQSETTPLRALQGLGASVGCSAVVGWALKTGAGEGVVLLRVDIVGSRFGIGSSSLPLLDVNRMAFAPRSVYTK